MSEEMKRLEKLLQDLLEEAKRETLFTFSIDRDRIYTSLMNAGYLVPLIPTSEVTLAPGATTTITANIPSGYVYNFWDYDLQTSLPWYVSCYIWIDSGPPAIPSFFFTRFPPQYKGIMPGVWPVYKSITVTLINLHATEPAYFISIHRFAVMKRDVWDMLKAVYLDPIVEYIRMKSAERTGVPAP